MLPGQVWLATRWLGQLSGGSHGPCKLSMPLSSWVTRRPAYTILSISGAKQ